MIDSVECAVHLAVQRTADGFFLDVRESDRQLTVTVRWRVGISSRSAEVALAEQHVSPKGVKTWTYHDGALLRALSLAGEGGSRGQ
jgi:hypothetical protein